MVQYQLFPQRVRLATRRHVGANLGARTVRHVVDGFVTKDFRNGTVLVQFDGKRRIGFITGCELIVRRKDLVPL